MSASNNKQKPGRNTPPRRNRAQKREALLEGSAIEIEVHGLSPQGDGIATVAGREVFVPDLFPGENATVRILDVAKKRPLARARVLTRTQDHPDRRPVPCTHHSSHPEGECSGCPLMALGPAAQHALKRDQLRQRYGFEVDRFESSDATLGYRYSAKRVVAGQPGALFLGSYRRDSHRVAVMTDCQVDHPRIRECTQELVEVANRMGLRAYRPAPPPETDGTPIGPAIGDLRYAWFKTDGEGVLLTLITGEAQNPTVKELAQALKTPSGVAWSIQSQAGNSLRGNAATMLCGTPKLNLKLADQPVEVGPLGFLQPNPPVAEMAYRDLTCRMDGSPLDGAHACDLYAGAGVTTALLRERFTQVSVCESHPESALALGIAPLRAEDFLANLESAGHSAPALMIANPPRTGLGASVCSQLLRIGPQRLHIMSCNPGSLRRDLDALAPGFEIEGMRAYDTLPQTAHMELVVWLRQTATPTTNSANSQNSPLASPSLRSARSESRC